MDKHQIEQEKYNRFYKSVEDIQSLYKAQIAGNLVDYFKIKSNFEKVNEYYLEWTNKVESKIVKAVEYEAEKILNA